MRFLGAGVPLILMPKLAILVLRVAIPRAEPAMGFSEWLAWLAADLGSESVTFLIGVGGWSFEVLGRFEVCFGGTVSEDSEVVVAANIVSDSNVVSSKAAPFVVALPSEEPIAAVSSPW